MKFLTLRLMLCDTFKHFDYIKIENRQALVDIFINNVVYYGDIKGKVRYNVTDFLRVCFTNKWWR